MKSDSSRDSAETGNEQREWLFKLERTCAGTNVKHNMFGRRPATPHEVEMALAARRSKTDASGKS